MSITPAFSPGPWITQGALVGSVRRWIFEDLYEQCSFHIAEKMPSSVKLGTRPISLRMRSYSSGLSPCSGDELGGNGGLVGNHRGDLTCAAADFTSPAVVIPAILPAMAANDRRRHALQAAVPRIAAGHR